MKTIPSKDGTAIAYDLLGEGQPLLFITGATCFRNFKPALDDAKILASAYQVYNYDRRGRGDSGDTAPYAIQKEVDDIEALIDSAGGRASLYGHSSGAVLALEAALRMPDKVSKLIIYDPAYVHNETERVSYDSLRKQIEEFLRQKAYAKAVRCFLVGIGMPKIFVFFLPLMPGWKTMKALAPTLLYDIELTKELPPLQRLAKISVPTTILYGEKSPESVKAVAKGIAKVLPGSTSLEIKGQDHMASAKTLLPHF